MAAKKTAVSGSLRRRPASAKDIAVPAANPSTDVHAPATPCPVVGIGASAGGLEALTELLENIPCDTGIAFVIVTHQLAGHASLLPELLGHATQMPVAEIYDGVVLAPDHVYLSPPSGFVGLRNSRLYLMAAPAGEALRLPINYFFCALASDRRDHAICVVLSGTGTDGTLGLKAIKAEGGMAMAQQPLTAKYAGMPSNAIATGLVDYVLPLVAIPRQLMTLVAGNRYVGRRTPVSSPTINLAEPLAKILLLLEGQTGHDFSSYKLNTIRRRIERRMHVHQLGTPADYLRYLQDSPEEIDSLFRELLINVTRFFRDPEMYSALIQDWLPTYLESLSDSRSLRIWVPGCSSGEEVFSLAIALHEYMTQTRQSFAVQIFGTDLDTDAIDSARRGLYPDGVVEQVSSERLQKYFTREETGYRIVKEIRRMAIFAPQSLVRDPPFTRLDLVSCRNVLIYMNPELQQKLLAAFAYSLKPGGVLVLGTSETVGPAEATFETIDKKCKLFRRRANSLAVPASLRSIRARTDVPPITPMPREGKSLSLIERALLTRLCPPSIVFDERGDIFHVQGRTGSLLEPAEGRPRMNVLEMAREGLRRPLAHAIRQLAVAGHDAATEGVVAQVQVQVDGPRLDMSVLRIQDPEALRGLILATFCPSSAVPVREPAPTKLRKGTKTPDYVGVLERELQRATQSLQSTVEQLETTNDELISANEEAQSTNEELQSSNEELETSQEELQSLNEELLAVNAELRQKIDLLSQASDDMQNLLNSTDIATIFLDRHLRIKRYTESATTLINLIASDIGRSIEDLRTRLKYPRMVDDCRDVMRTLEGIIHEAQTVAGVWYRIRVLPYRTTEQSVEGLVLTFDNVDALKKAQRASEASDATFESVVNTVRELLLVIDEDQIVVRANHSFYRMFSLTPGTVEGTSIYSVVDAAWDVPRLRELLTDILPDNPGFENYPLECDFPRLGYRRFLLNARRLEREPGLPGMILLAMEDVTDRAPARTVEASAARPA